MVIAAGLEVPERQVDLGAGTWVGRVDFYFRRARLVVEIDSERHHTSKLDAEADAHRDATMRAASFHVLRISDAQLGRPLDVVAAVRGALSSTA